MIVDETSEEDSPGLSQSSIRLVHTSIGPKWNRLVTGRVVAVMEPGHREFVCSVGEANGTGYNY